MSDNKNHILIVGDFAQGMPLYSGQTAKVRDYDYYIRKHFKNSYIYSIDTHYYKKDFFNILFSLVRACSRCNSLVLLLCGDGYGIKTLLPLIIILKKLFKFKIFFSIVGGGIVNDFDTKFILKKWLKCVDNIYVETNKIKDKLISNGIGNVKCVPVFSKRKRIENIDIAMFEHKPLRLCTYSRVCKEKGITDAIKSVIEVNKHFGHMVCMIDIYGPPIEEYKNEFNHMIICAEGAAINRELLTDDNAIEELSKHYLMLFPTYYEGEGFPIAIIECFKAGVPIVATDWHNNSEIIKNNFTGIIYNKNSDCDLSKILISLLNNKKSVYKMKENCIKEALKYDPDNILESVYNDIEKWN